MTIPDTPLTPGVGLGWRPPVAGVVDSLPALAFSEVIAESIVRPGGDHAHVPELLARLRDGGTAAGRTPVPVVAHGVGLNLGSAGDFDPARIDSLALAGQALGSPLVSEHVCFTRAGGVDVGHLTPVPRTREAVDVLARNISATTAGLDVPLALENITGLVDWPEDELTEAQFLREVLERTDTLLLLDVANVYARAVTRGLDPYAEMLALPLERIAYCHVAGGALDAGGVYHDTHAHPVPDEVFRMVTALVEAAGGVPLMIERDADHPPLTELCAELDRLADSAGLPRPTGTVTPAGPVGP